MCLYALVYFSMQLRAYLCIHLLTSAYLCVPLPIPLYTSVYPCLGQRYTDLEVNREVNRGTHLCIPLFTSAHTSVYLCPALGRGTQRYTEVCASAYLCLPLCTSVSSAFYHVSKSRFPGIIQKHGIKKQTKVSCQPGSLPTTAMPGF